MDQQEILDAPAKVVEYTKIEAGIAELNKKYGKVVFDVTTTEGDKAARAARQECVKLRTTLEAKRKAIKAPALQRCRDIDDEAKRITKAIEAVETPIDDAIKAEERRKEDERIERLRIETEKREKVSQAISDMAFLPVYASGKSSADVAIVIAELRDRALSEDEFGDRLGEAGIAKSAAIAKLEELHAAAIAHEAAIEQARVDAENQRLESERIATERSELDAERAELEAERSKLESAKAAVAAPAVSAPVVIQQTPVSAAPACDDLPWPVNIGVDLAEPVSDRTVAAVVTAAKSKPLVERLRASPTSAIMIEAADYIDVLREALEVCRFALEPYDDIKPRDWTTDREKLRRAHKAASDALTQQEQGK